MATYRLEAKIIGRSQGRSATASAAYRSAEQITDERTGQSFDYTRKRGVLYAEVLAPEGTPEWMLDRAQLWNAVEQVEKRKDAQLARDVLLSLPHELTHEQRCDLVQEFARTEFVDKGMIADIAIHSPDRRGDDRNYHAHVMLTMRALTGDGFGNKVRDWNGTEQLEQWREHWAQTVNQHLERYGHDARVDHRSLADQGIDREPEPKQGPVATEMERYGRPSHAGDDRRAVQERNDDRAAVEAQIASVTAEIIDLEKARATKVGPAGQGGMSENITAEEAARRVIAAAEQKLREQAQRDEASKQPAEQLAREQVDHQVRQAKEMQEQRDQLLAFEADQKRRAEEARQEEDRKREAHARGQQAEGEIRDAGDRYRVALGQNYDVRDPYGSLSRTAMAEYGSFIQDRERLTQQIAQEKDPEARKALELRQQIEHADYMAITDRRIASISEVSTRRRDNETAVWHRERAADFEAQSKDLRQQYRDHVSGEATREVAQLDQRDFDAGVQQHQENENRPPERSESNEERPREESGADKEARETDYEATKNTEVTDSKSARIAKIIERGEQFESEQKASEHSQTLDLGGMSR